jgi:NADH dehydrogenase
VEGEATTIDVVERRIALRHAGESRSIGFDALVLCSGSALHRPAIRGIEHALSVDTYAEAAALDAHLCSLDGSSEAAAATAVVVGAGFTGIEVATGLLPRMHSIAKRNSRIPAGRVVLVERNPEVASDLAEVARPHVREALLSLGIETRVGKTIESIDAEGVTLAGGERIAAGTTIWTGGLRASALASQVPGMRDELGRVPVDEYLRVRGVENVYAAGDVARAMADRAHVPPMSCQHAIPMGERAGRNASLALLGRRAEAVPYSESEHVVCLDLGAAGALFVEGWSDAAVVKLTGIWGRHMKEMINTRLIYPDRRAIDHTASAA